MCSRTPTSAHLPNKEEDGSHYNRVAGVDANFRLWRSQPQRLRCEDLSPQEAVPGSGEDFAARGAVNYQSRRLQLRATTTALPSGSATRWASSSAGRRQRAQHGRVNFRPTGHRKTGYPGNRSALADGHVPARDGQGLESRYQDDTCRSISTTAHLIEIGVNPNVEVIRQEFTINSARRAGRAGPL